MKIAIKGHKLRGREVIQILESLGGQNIHAYWGHSGDDIYYYINEHCKIVYNPIDVLSLYNYKLYTLEEFEKEFPFKVGDKVKHITSVGTIIKYCYIDNKPGYEVKSMELGIIAKIPAEILKPYKEMQEERNITLSLEKAKEWYKKGGELKEVALQAYSEEELNSLPRSWEEFCRRYSKIKKEAYIGIMSAIHSFVGTNCDRDVYADRNICPSKQSAEAHLALIQLEQLRDCWRQGWEPTEDDTGYCILKYPKDYHIMTFNFRSFLSFPTRKMAEDFLECFRDLIEKAGDLI